MKAWSDLGIDTRGRASGEIKVTCPQCSPHRKKRSFPCLNVNLDKGVFHCWHCGWSGGLGQGTQIVPRYTKVYRRPDYVAQASGLPTEVVQWFASRGITESVLRRNQVGAGRAYFPQVEEERGCVMFPYLRGSEVINVKYRTRDKLFRMAGGAERVLYGLNDIGDRLVWVEGEMDKLSLDVAGIASCVSVPDGAPAVDAKNYETKFDFLGDEALSAASHHIIAVDADAPGQRLRDELIRRLGPDRCSVVTWPDGCKDANDVLMQLGASALAQCIAAARPVPVDGAHDVSEFADAMRELYERPQRLRGVSTGWPAIDRHYTVLPGEWTLVTGIPGHGKSEWLDALCVNLARLHGWSFAVFSPENSPVTYHLQKLAEKYIGKPYDDGPTPRMSVNEREIALTFLDEHFTILQPDDRSPEALLDRARQLVQRKGIRGLVLDPWNEMEHVRDRAATETEYISGVLSKLRAFAKAHDVHVWLVAHPKQLLKDKAGGYPVPTPYDVSGSAHWRNKADNCVTVHRDVMAEHSAVDIHVQKVRKKSVGRPGLVTLQYDNRCGQYRDSPPGPAYSMTRDAA